MSVNIQTGFADRPMGMQDGYPDFAKRRRAIESRLVDFFDGLGYELVSSGVFEYVETLLRTKSSEAAKDWVQLFDISGQTIALRPEMTPSIARMAAPLLAAKKGPIRWCYAERVYRRTSDPASLSWASGKAAESTQVGVEWIGEGGISADADILGLCHRALASLGLRETQVVVSHARFVPALLDALGVSTDAIPRLLDCLTRGDYVAFERALPVQVKVDVLQLLMTLSPFEPTELEKRVAPDQWVNVEAKGRLFLAWESLCALAEVLTNETGLSHITFDLTLHRDISYYTGLVFEVFAPGVGAPIALGGRYDDLLEQFGACAPAVGMAFEIERVLAVLQANDSPTPSTQEEDATC